MSKKIYPKMLESWGLDSVIPKSDSLVKVSRKPRSEKQKENDMKLKVKFQKYRDDKKSNSEALSEVIKVCEDESDTELLIREGILFPSVDDMIKKIDKKRKVSSKISLI